MTQNPNPVLFYHSDGFKVARQDLKGRHSAGESFFSAFLDQNQHGDIYALCPDKESQAEFEESVRSFGRSLRPRSIGRIDVETLRQQRILNLPMPAISTEARTRSFLSDDAYAICGVTHTISSRNVMEGVADVLVSPVQTWDALICTSKSVHHALSSVLTSTEDYLRERMGAQHFTRPMMPIIPLGIHTQRFTRKEEDRTRWRNKLGLAPDTITVLFFGRLSVHAKSSPFQMAQAAEAAAKASKQLFAVIWCGRFVNDFQRRVFMEIAQAMAPSVPFHHVDGGDAEVGSIWSAADIFCSLSDNIQESFGLTVIEAMAAQLPVVVSNWNGYREAVEHEKNGILIDSYLPASSFDDIAYRYFSGADSFDFYVGGMSQQCFVDLKQTTSAFIRLAGDPALRARLSAAARQTVESNFDWKAVMPRYLDLWSEQLERLDQARTASKPKAMLSSAFNPGLTYAAFPSSRLEGQIALARGPSFALKEDFLKRPGVVVTPVGLGTRTQFDALRAIFRTREPLSVDAVLAAFKEPERDQVLRMLHWTIKVGILRIA